MNGLLVIDKPSGITSRDAVNRAQRWFPPRTKVGHTGTLDPLATGVLVMCVGNATRLAAYVQGMDKVYETTLVLGARSDTDDADGTIALTPDAVPVSELTVRSALPRFVGNIEQTPPAFSAVKVGGRRAYELARRGAEFEIGPRTVNVYGISLLAYAWPALALTIHCGKGTYIRSLARDLGEFLGCGAFVQALRRTRVGPFRAEDAINLDDDAAIDSSKLLPPERAVAHLPTVIVDAAAADILRRGRAIPLPPALSVAPDSDLALLDAQRQLVGIGTTTSETTIQPRKVFT